MGEEVEKLVERLKAADRMVFHGETLNGGFARVSLEGAEVCATMGLFAEAATTLERVERDNDRLRQVEEDLRFDCEGMRQQVEAMRKALEPFAEAAEGVSDLSDAAIVDCDVSWDIPHGTDGVMWDCTVGDFRRAAQALAAPASSIPESSVSAPETYPVDTLLDALADAERDVASVGQQHIPTSKARAFCSGKANGFRAAWELVLRFRAPVMAEARAGDQPDERPLGDTAWKRFRDEKPTHDGFGERSLLTWNVRSATYDHACIDGEWRVGEQIDGHADDLWRWLDVNPERHLPAAPAPACVNHPGRSSLTNLDGDELCLECANAWARGEGEHAAYLEAQDRP